MLSLSLLFCFCFAAGSGCLCRFHGCPRHRDNCPSGKNFPILEATRSLAVEVSRRHALAETLVPI